TAPVDSSGPRAVKPGVDRYPLAAEQLGRMLLGAAAERLGSRRLVIIADGALHLVPFGAVSVPGTLGSGSFTPLAMEHEIVNLPSASTLAAIRRQAPLRGVADKTVAVFADPVFSLTDTRIREIRPIPPTERRSPKMSSPAPESNLLLRGGMETLQLPRLRSTA